MPSRIQLSRARGWRKPEGAVVVSRPSKWGNPYKLEDYPTGMSSEARRSHAVEAFRSLLLGKIALPWVTLRFTIDDVRRELRGKDLACWCKRGQPCHADVLLRLANEPERTP
jgi:hypothetical protein